MPQGEEQEEEGTVSTRETSQDGWENLEDEVQDKVVVPWAEPLLDKSEKEALKQLPAIQQMLAVLVKAGYEEAALASGYELSPEAKAAAEGMSSDLRRAVKIQYNWEDNVNVKWYVIEVVLPGNRIVHYAFRQLEDGTWIFRMK